MAILTAFILRQAIFGPVFGADFTYILFFPAVMVVATIAGSGPGLLATALSAIVSVVWIFPSGPTSAHYAVSLMVFSGMGIVMSVVAERYRGTRVSEESLRESEARLRRSEGNLRDFVENASVGLHWVGSDGTIIWANKTELDMMGYAREEYVGHHIARFHADTPVIEDILARLTRAETLQEYPARLRCKDGSIRDVLINSNVLFEEGKFVHTRCFTRDITKRKQAEEKLLQINSEMDLARRAALTMMEEATVAREALRESEERFKLVARASSDAVWDWDLITNAIWWNEGVQKLFGYTREQVIPTGQWWYDHIHPNDRERVVHGIHQVIDGEGENWSDDYRYQCADGSYLEVLDRGFVVRDGAGKAIRMLGGMTNISERKRAEEALRQSENRFRAVVNQATAGIAQTDLTGRFLLINQRYCEMMGYTEAELLQMRMQEVTHPDDLHRNLEQFKALASGGPDFIVEKRYVRKNGEHIWVSNNVAGIRETDGALVSIVAIAIDITERLRAEEALRKAGERLRFMAESMPQKIFTATRNGDVDYFNGQWTEFTGLTFEQIRAWGWLQFIHPDDVEENIRRWKHSIETGEYFQFEHRFRRHDGTYRWHLSRAHAMRDPNADIQMWIGSNTDIDDQKRAEEQLERTVTQRTAELTETIGELEAFSYSIVHDLRAPLRSMQGYSMVLIDECGPKLDPEEKIYLNRIKSSAERMDRLILDVLSFSQISRSELKLQPVNMDNLLRDILEAYPNLRAQRGQIVIEGTLPIVVGNEAALTQCLSNLLGNAVKFVAPGTEPFVRVWAEQSNDRTRIFFTDNGIGIPEQTHERIFGLFQRATKDYQGTGIGLPIVKKSVERMGGAVGLKSEVGKGSTFWLELKLAPSEKNQGDCRPASFVALQKDGTDCPG